MYAPAIVSGKEGREEYQDEHNMLSHRVLFKVRTNCEEQMRQ